MNHPPGADVQAAIRIHFEGQRALYDAFAGACTVQFEADARAGQRACAAADLADLRRICHDLKTVLAMLGHPGLSALAGQCERLSLACNLAGATRAWRRLHVRLQRLRLATATPHDGF